MRGLVLPTNHQSEISGRKAQAKLETTRNLLSEAAMESAHGSRAAFRALAEGIERRKNSQG